MKMFPRISLMMCMCYFLSVSNKAKAQLPGIPIKSPISTCVSVDSSCLAGMYAGPSLPYNQRCYRLFWYLQKGTWNTGYSDCVKGAKVPYYPIPPGEMDWGRIVVIPDNALYKTVVENFSGNNGSAAGYLWVGATASSNPASLSSYTWVTDQSRTTPGSVVTSKSIAVTSNTAATAGPYCLAVNIGWPASFAYMSCDNENDKAFSICEYGCGTPPPATCAGTCDLDPSAMFTTPPPVVTTAPAINANSPTAVNGNPTPAPAPASGTGPVPAPAPAPAPGVSDPGPAVQVTTPAITTTTVTTTTTTRFVIKNPDLAFLNFAKSDPLALTTSIREAIPYITRQENKSLLSELGYQANEIIKSCLVNGQSVSVSGMRPTLDPTFGNCYTFNNDTPLLWSNRAGVQEGIELLLLSRQDNYTCSSDSAGFRIVLHNNSEWPFPDVEGDYIAPGTVTRIAITKVNIKKLGQPYDRCQVIDVDPKKYFYFGGYTEEGCERSCIQNFIIDSCGCGDPRLEKPPNNTFCNITQKACVDQAYKCAVRGDIDNLKCDCWEPCEQIIYQRSVSSARFFDKNCQDALTPSAECPDATSNFITAQVEIFYKRLNEIDMYETPLYDMMQVWNEINNYLGLWLGCGIFGLVELAFCLILIIYMLIICQPCRSHCYEDNR